MKAVLSQLFLWLWVVSHTVTAAELTYSAFAVEAASEYQVADRHLGPGLVRFIAQAEVALSEDVTAKAVISPCLGSYSAEAESGTQCAKGRLVEELILKGGDSAMDFSLGRQIVTQGNTEGFVILDRFNGRDMCRFARLDIQNKLPNWIAKGRAFWGDNSFAMTFAPFSAESEIPDPTGYCNDRFHDLGRFAAQENPDNNSIADWAGGAEWALNRDSWSTTFNVLSTREDLFVLELLPSWKKIRPRTLWLGGSTSATLNNIVLRGEIAFAPERDFTIDPNALSSVLMSGMNTNGIEKRWNLLSVIGAELQRGDWYWALQYYDDRVASDTNESRLVRDLESHFASLRVRRTFANEEVVLNSFAIWDMDYRDFAVRASVTYEFNVNTTLELGGTLYADFGGTPGLFGSYDGRESVFMNLRTNF